MVTFILLISFTTLRPFPATCCLADNVLIWIFLYSSRMYRFTFWINRFSCCQVASSYPSPSIFEDCERSKTGQWQRPRNEANEHAKLPLPLKILFSKCKCVEEEWVSFISETYQQLLEKDTTVTDSTTSSGRVLVSILNTELPSHCFEEF